MGKMKEVGSKSKQNQSKAMVPASDGQDRAAREAAIAALAMQGYEAVADAAEGEIQEIEVVEKEVLQNVPLVVIDVKQIESKSFQNENGEASMFLFVTCLCEDGKVRAFTDGGSGIVGQLGALIGKIDPRDPSTLIRCPGGLKPSEPYKNRINGAMTVTWRLAQHEKKEKSLRAATGNNSRAAARA
jgi:hypothetical protein